jgi:hypothetical protein
MKKIIYLAVATVLLFPSCRSQKGLSTLGWSKNGCPLERLDWMEVSSGYDSKKILEIATQLQASLQADVKQLNGAGKADGKFTSTLNSIINSKGEGKIQVSQEFYESYVNKRSGICAIYQGLKSRVITDEAAKKDAQKLYLELAQSFGQVAADEEKKNQH